MAGLIRKPKDFFAGLLFLGLALGTVHVAQDYAMGTARRMGPGYFPTLLAWMLAGMALILIVRSLFGLRDGIDRFALKPLLLVTAGAVAFALLLRPAGLVVALVTLVLIGAAGSSESRPLPSLLLALGLAAGSVLVFVVGLGQPFPVIGFWFAG